MAKVKRLFWIEDYSGTIEDADLHEVKQFGDADDLQWAAEQYAEYYHDNRDGWEASWPLVFSVADENGKFLGKVSVERESRPEFHGVVERQS
jgi:hypothetical protein